MTEERFAYRIRQGLNQSLGDISPSALRRLEAARHLAVDRQKQTVQQPVLAGAGAGHSSTVFGGSFFHHDRSRQILAVFALITGMALALYWQSHQYISDLEEIDSAVLSDTIPPEAFLDKGFAAWLSDSSED